jgi:hypothetical protein
VPAPPIPDQLAARIETALAAESDRRAAAAPDGPPATHRRARTAPARRPRPVPLARLAAGAALLVVIGGGTYAALQLGGSTGASSTSGSSASSSGGSVAAGAPERSAAGSGRSRHSAGLVTPGIAGTPGGGPAVSYQRGGQAATIRPLQSATDYQPGQLAGQVRATLASAAAQRAGHSAARPPIAPVPSGGRLDAGQLGQLGGCLSRIGGGQAVLLADVARFAGAPATIIVTAGRGGGAEQIWVVGSGCSRSASDLLAHRSLPGR